VEERRKEKRRERRERRNNDFNLGQASHQKFFFNILS
jgi:hypothetical protein